MDPAYILVDDGVSDADFVRREGYSRLMNALKPRAPFQALVMMELARLGRSLDEVPYAICKITERLRPQEPVTRDPAADTASERGLGRGRDRAVLQGRTSVYRIPPRTGDPAGLRAASARPSDEGEERFWSR